MHSAVVAVRGRRLPPRPGARPGKEGSRMSVYSLPHALPLCAYQVACVSVRGGLEGCGRQWLVCAKACPQAHVCKSGHASMTYCACAQEARRRRAIETNRKRRQAQREALAFEKTQQWYQVHCTHARTRRHQPSPAPGTLTPSPSAHLAAPRGSSQQLSLAKANSLTFRQSDFESRFRQSSLVRG